MSPSQESSCSRIAPKLMALYSSEKKADQLWKDNCQESYESALGGASINGDQVMAVLAKLRAENAQ